MMGLYDIAAREIAANLQRILTAGRISAGHPCLIAWAECGYLAALLDELRHRFFKVESSLSAFACLGRRDQTVLVMFNQAKC